MTSLPTTATMPSIGVSPPCAFADKKGIQEIKQAGLGKLLPEDNLEAYVRKRVDELAHYYS